MAFTFDGVDKIISFDVSTTSFDVRDLWSRWVDWLLTSDNSKYDLAMRVVGGDPLPGSKELGLSYFMLNDWKIRPYEETQVLSVNGNIYSEDGSSPFTPVLGAYNVTIINTVSNLVDSTVQQLPEIEFASFQNVVAIDVDNGVAGTTYPLGLLSNPVDNLADAKIIATARGIRTLHLLSNLEIDSDESISNLKIKSDNWKIITIGDGAESTDTEFEKVSIYGKLSGTWNVFDDCWLYDVTNFLGWMRGGSYINIELAPYTMPDPFTLGSSYFDNIVPMYANTPCTLVMNSNVSVTITGSSEIHEIKNMGAGETITIGLQHGKAIIDSSCTGGDIYVMGVGSYENNSLLTINDGGLVNPELVSDYVWDATNADHLITGSTGKALSTASTGGVDVDALATAVWERDLETNFSAEEILRILAGVLAGVTTGADGLTMKFRDLNNTKDRVTAILDGLGNRTTVTKDVS